MKDRSVVSSECDVDEKVLVLLSGGVDSQTALREMVKAGCNVYSLSIKISSHDNDLEAARRGALLAGVAASQRFEVDLSTVGSMLHEGDVFAVGGANSGANCAMPGFKTVDQSLKMLHMLGVMCATSHGIKKVCWAVHADDGVSGLDSFVQLYADSGVELVTPFLKMSKGEVLRLGVSMGLVLSETWTCADKSAVFQCGRCEQCEKLKVAKSGSVFGLMLQNEVEVRIASITVSTVV